MNYKKFEYSTEIESIFLNLHVNKERFLKSFSLYLIFKHFKFLYTRPSFLQFIGTYVDTLHKYQSGFYLRLCLYECTCVILLFTLFSLMVHLIPVVFFSVSHVNVNYVVTS